MSALAGIFVAGSAVLGGSGTDSLPAGGELAPTELQRPTVNVLRAYLGQPRAPSPRFLDHGVLSLGVAPGYPQLYRLEAGLGLLDHLRVGVTTHWFADQRSPVAVPQVAVAFVRRRGVEVGVRYEQLLHAPPPSSAEAIEEEPNYRKRSHYLLSTAAFSQTWYTVGMDLGAARYRLPDTFNSAETDVFVERTRLAGGLFARVGNRRWGLTLQGLMPQHTVECLFDLRFDLFGYRDLGRWNRSSP
ncbi:MAG: hypothetical protein V3V08_03010 [Nannocystaceae bacterium]